jgi:hypothetical protein
MAIKDALSLYHGALALAAWLIVVAAGLVGRARYSVAQEMVAAAAGASAPEAF